MKKVACGVLAATLLHTSATAFPAKLYHYYQCKAAHRGKAPDLRRMERCPPMVLPPGARIIDGSVVMPWPGQPGYALPRGSS
jgi:hypothetical protein